MRRVIVPVTLFSVHYETGAGRPYSEFERLMLRAVADGISNLAALQAHFQLHRRVIIEALVTLIHAGWAALGADEAEIIMTPDGGRALAEETTPTTLRVKRPDPATVVMEQVTGELAHQSQVRYHKLKRAKRQFPRADVLAPSEHLTRLEVGAVQHLLPCAADEWVRWIDPRIDVRSVGAHCAIAEIEEETGRVRGLPEAYVDALDPVLRTFVSPYVGLSTSLEGDSDGHPELRPATWRVSMAEEDVIVGVNEHAAMLDHALERADTRVLIASAFLTERAINQVGFHIAAAVHRGVCVDVLWGYAAGVDEAGLTALDRLAREVDGGPGQLRFNRRPAASHMKLLAWDQDSAWSAVIGSHNWLSAYRSIPLVDLSLRVQSREVMATLARHTSSIWRATPGEEVSPGPNAWQAVAAELSERKDLYSPGAPAEGVEVSLVYGRSHERELRRTLRESQSRVLIASHHATSDGLSRLKWGAEIERPANFRGYVIVGELLGETAWEEVQETSTASACSAFRKDLHAKVLVADGAVVVGSYNFLAADPTGRGGRTRELSVKVNDSEFANVILQRFVDAVM